MDKMQGPKGRFLPLRKEELEKGKTVGGSHRPKKERPREVSEAIQGKTGKKGNVESVEKRGKMAKVEIEPTKPPEWYEPKRWRQLPKATSKAGGIFYFMPKYPSPATPKQVAKKGSKGADQKEGKENEEKMMTDNRLASQKKAPGK